MNKKLIIDLIMFILIILLMDLTFLKLELHEWVGLLIFIIFIVHKYLNWRFIKKSTFNLNKLSIYNKLNYYIGWIMFVNTLVVVWTGIIIAREIEWLFMFQTDNIIYWSNWHHFASYILLLLLAFHLGLHLKIIVRQLKKIFNIRIDLDNQLKVIIKLLIILWGTLSIINSKMIPYIKAPFTKDIYYKYQAEQLDKMAANTAVSLEEYLGNMFCNGCRQRCSLLAPMCSIGVEQVKVATVEYETQYTANQVEDIEEVPYAETKPIVNVKNPEPTTSIFELLGIIMLFVIVGNETYKIIIKR